MNRSANTERGEAELSIGGKVHVLRPSFENLVAAEAELGSLFALVETASQGGLTLEAMTALLWHCVADEDRPPRGEVGAAVLAMGLVAAVQPVRTILAQVLQGQT